MAASRVLSRLSSRSLSLSPKLHKNTVSPSLSPLKSSSQSDPARRISRVARLPLALTSLMSMMPLHNAVASARLTSALSIDSQSWGLIPQGISMPL